MSLSIVPEEIKEHIVSFLYPPLENPSRRTRGALRESVAELGKISAVSKEFFEVCALSLKQTRDSYCEITEAYFEAKYTKYNRTYREEIRRQAHPAYRPSRRNPRIDPKAKPPLLDALFTGCELLSAHHTFDTYNREIEADIREMVRLAPAMIKCQLGDLRCRSYVSPLTAACVNEHIPIHIIELLLQNGADPNTAILINLEFVQLLEDLREYDNKRRLAAIRVLFIRYGYVKERPESVCC